MFDEGVDVVLTPMFTHRPGRGARVRGPLARSGPSTAAPATSPYTGVFNHTGQPAAAVPAGFAGDGFPLSVQLVGPPDGEGVLLSLAAQLERARGWPAHRPAAAA